jgi:hypothetical protein
LHNQFSKLDPRSDQVWNSKKEARGKLMTPTRGNS